MPRRFLGMVLSVCLATAALAAGSGPAHIVSTGNGRGATALPQTELERVAASMAPGTWAEVSTMNMVPTLYADGIGGSILDYAEGGAWDPVTQQFLFIGCDHPYDSNGDLARFVAYSAESNSWRVMPYPSWLPNSIMHGYDHNAIDVGRGYFYHRMYSQPVVHRYDIQAETWSTLPIIPSSVLPYSTCCMGLEYFPEMDGLVLAATTHESVLDEAVFYSESTGQWSTIADGRPMGTHNHFVEYNPVRHSVLFGGGSGSAALYTLYPDGTVVNHAPAPFNLGILASIVTVDPVSGVYLVLGGAGEFYAFDEDADTWTPLPGAVPVFSPVRGTSLVWQTLAAPIPEYGVVMFVKFYYALPESQAWVYLYKHAAR